MSAFAEPRPPIPPFTCATAIDKIRKAEDARSSRNPERVSLAYTPDSRWRNRSKFIKGRLAIISLSQRKWAHESDFHLIKALWAFSEDRIAVRFAYEWYEPTGGGSGPTATRTGPSMRKG